jgi:hypothetical protein
MLDNLRSQASFQEEEPLDQNPPKPSMPRKPRRSFDQITGTTARQRFVLAIMLFLVVCLLGLTIVLITGRIVLPFLQ